MAQLASASGLGPEGPVFESLYPDRQKKRPEFGRFFVITDQSHQIRSPPFQNGLKAVGNGMSHRAVGIAGRKREMA